MENLVPSLQPPPFTAYSLHSAVAAVSTHSMTEPLSTDE